MTAADILQVAKGLAAGGVITLVGLNGNVVNVTTDGYLESVDTTARDLLNNTTYGLSAIYDAISGTGGVDTDLSTILNRLTSARAGYLDELGSANIPADVDSLLARLTTARAGYLDNINFNIDTRLGTPSVDVSTDIANVKVDTNKVVSDLSGAATTGTVSYLVAGGEQTALEFAKTNIYSLLSLHLDLANFTTGRIITARVYSKIDGTNYRIIDIVNYTVGSHDAVTISPQFNLNNYFKITLQIDTVEIGDVSIPYRYVLTNYT